MSFKNYQMVKSKLLTKILYKMNLSEFLLLLISSDTYQNRTLNVLLRFFFIKKFLENLFGLNRKIFITRTITLLRNSCQFPDE